MLLILFFCQKGQYWAKSTMRLTARKAFVFGVVLVRIYAHSDYPTFRLSLRILPKCWKIRTKTTPNKGIFQVVTNIALLLYLCDRLCQRRTLRFVCVPVCDVINFEINFDFLIQLFSYIIKKKLGQKCKYLKNKNP